MTSGTEVRAFDIPAFKEVLRNASSSSNPAIESKPQVEYLESYFATIKPVTMVVEQEYIDRDFLEDYSAYYVRCFSPYSRFCKRILFFSESFTESDFMALLKGTVSPLTIQILKESFLGFMVLKPLPFSVIGRTCLKTFKDNGERTYPINRKYFAHLCGIELVVESLAFQEQDSVAGACATTALWSAFHATSRKFQHAMPSPFEITRAATTTGFNASRTFPNAEGLSIQEMAQAVRSVGLEPHTVAAGDEATVKSAIYAYQFAGIPILLAVELWDIEPAEPKIVAGHAMAITGFGVQGTPAIPVGPTKMLDESSRINRIYVHDDGLGPFARMEFDGKMVQTDIKNGVPRLEYSLSTTWKNDTGNTGSIRAVPKFLIVPVYHKIRIPMRKIHIEIAQLDHWIENIRVAGVLPTLTTRLNWDIRLVTGIDVKESIMGSSTIDPDIKVKVLTASFPRFVGKVTAILAGNPVAIILFDLTGIDQGKAFLTVIPLDSNFAANMKAVASEPTLEAAISHTPAWNVFSWFKDN